MDEERMKSLPFMKSIVMFLLVFFLHGTCRSETAKVVFPLTIDYPFLQSLFHQAAYREPGGVAIFRGDDSDCNKVILSEPRFSKQDDVLRFETRLEIFSGIPIFGACRFSSSWNGYLILYERPEIDPNTYRLSFVLENSAIEDENHMPAEVMETIWDLVRPSVLAYLSQVRIDLLPPVEELKSFLQPQFPQSSRELARQLVDTLASGDVHVNESGLQFELVSTIDRKYIEKQEEQPLTPLSVQEMDTFISMWENWDSFMVALLMSMLDHPLTEEERFTLQSTLLETRYLFVQELMNEQHDKDFVREQFIEVWQKLAPIFKKYFRQKPSDNPIRYISFFAAADALSVLDQLGPAFNIDISRAGLNRMIKLVSANPSITLAYKLEVDPDLRKLLGMSDPLPTHGVAFEGDEVILDPDLPDTETSSVDRLRQLLLLVFENLEAKPAFAGDKKQGADPGKLKEWLISGQPMDVYLEKVKEVVRAAAIDNLKKSKMPSAYHDVYKLSVMSTTWQESCFRQFKERKGKVSVLRSYNNTSIGLMQINERVWRGVYDLQHLSWDVRYNAKAGCEILDQYLVRYALPKMKKNTGIKIELVPQILYAMYNGGPREFTKFIQRNSKGSLYQSDKLFLEKHQWVMNEDWQKIQKCLGSR
ncbi:MAG: hypothetical protein C4522_06085 [Desulfobacteraceae bacterium]|nr:MAG: hypothetical protein C4522_06085 [Desulfobacteraceae bacterium]